MKKRFDIQHNRKDVTEVFLTTFHNKLQKRLKAKQDTEKLQHLSSKFAADFKEVLLRCFGSGKVQAESVYMQYMLHKGNVHIIKTKWKTLEDFVKYQGRLGTFLVEYSNKTWYVQSPSQSTEVFNYSLCGSDNTSADIFRDRFQTALKKLYHLDVSLQTPGVTGSAHTELITEKQSNSPPEVTESNKKQTWTIKRSKVQFKVSPRTSPYSKDRTVLSTNRPETCAIQTNTKQIVQKSALKEIMEEQEKARERQNRKSNWLQPGIIVNIATNKYGKQNCRKKGRIVGLVSQSSAVVHVMSTDSVLTVEQKHLKTCLPELGGLVRIVNGAYRYEKCVLEKMRPGDALGMVCSVRITGSLFSGRLLTNIHSDDISELYQG